MPDTIGEGESTKPSYDELISLKQAVELSGYSPSHLRLLVSSGEIWGTKLGRNWVTTEAAVLEYMARDIRPGPKPSSKSADSEK